MIVRTNDPCFSLTSRRGETTLAIVNAKAIIDELFARDWIADFEQRFERIAFSGCHEDQPDVGWTHGIIRYFAEESALKTFVLANGELKRSKYEALETEETPQGPIDIWFHRGNRARRQLEGVQPFYGAKHRVFYPMRDRFERVLFYKNFVVAGEDYFFKPVTGKMADCCRALSTQRPSGKQTFFYPANIQPRKGQLAFVQALPASVPAGARFIFCGRIKHPGYFDALIGALKERQLPSDYLGELGPEQMAHQFASNGCTVLFSESDHNPRVLYESVVANTPFLVSRTMKVNQGLIQCGFAIDSCQLFDYWKRLDEVRPNLAKWRARILDERSCYGVMLARSFQESSRYRGIARLARRLGDAVRHARYPRRRRRQWAEVWR